MARDCGTCTACCTYFAINDIGKKALSPCPHLSENADGFTSSACNNCTIHGEHPKVCKEYACMWVAGYGHDCDRPDASGVMVDSATPVENALRALPLWEGAHDAPEGRAAVKRISRSSKTPVMVCKFPEARLLRVVGRGQGHG
jgi:Fe-S-cluster containining protein